MALCPSLITLDLCGCHCDFKRRCTIMHWNLRSVTIVECDGYTRANLACLPRLGSFRYSGDFLEMPFFVQSHTALADLYIRFTHPVKEVNHKLKYCYFPKDYPASTSSPYVAMPSRYVLCIGFYFIWSPNHLATSCLILSKIQIQRSFNLIMPFF